MKRMLFLLLCAATLEARPIAFTNVNVIPMTSDAVLRKQVVIVDGERIVAIGGENDVVIPAEAQRIDGEGGYLLPGLIDLHVHVSQAGDFTLYVANGVTTVFNLAGDKGTLAMRGGGRLMPRLFTTGEQLVGVPSAERARKVVDDDAAAGYDGIKVYDDIAPEALPALIDEARTKGLLAVGHIPRNLTWQAMLAAKPDAIAHAEEFLYSPVVDGDMEKIVAGMKEGHISLITTLIAYDTIGRQVNDVEGELERGELRYVNPAIRRAWERSRNHYVLDFKPSRVPNLRRLLGFQKQLVQQLAAGGVRILVGTDGGGVPFVLPGYSTLDELRELVSAGLSPHQALRAATIDAARFLRHDADFGTIETGKSADLLLLRGNPLLDISNVTLRAGVMVRGRWLDNRELHAELTRLAARNHEEDDVVAALDTRGVEAAIAVAKRKKTRDTTLNELAYQLLLIDKQHDAALKLFRANVALHPESAMARESLQEVH